MNFAAVNTTSPQHINTARPLDPKVSVVIGEMLAKTRVKEAALLQLLQVLESRAGTPLEQPSDFEATIEVIHQLMSVLQVYMGIPCDETARAVRWMERRKQMREASKK